MYHQKNKTMENKTETTPTSEQVYAKYCIQAKANIQRETLKKKKRFLSYFLFALWFIFILATLFLYFFVSDLQIALPGLLDLIRTPLGVWIIAGFVIIALIIWLIIETRKPDFVNPSEIYKKAEELIKKEKEKLEKANAELSLLKKDNEL
jgi:amino acid transporter